MYDYLIVGAGLFGSTFAYEMTKAGKKCLIIEKILKTGLLDILKIILSLWKMNLKI